jgi:hypothetical protein
VDQALIDTVRRLVGADSDSYTLDEIAYWTDAQLETLIGEHVSGRYLQVPVTLYGQISGQGRTEFRSGRVTVRGRLDTSSVVIVDLAGDPVDGATVHDDGRVTFTADAARAGPLFSGVGYDVHAAAAEALEQWASAVKLAFDITTDGQTLTRSQRYTQLVDRARQERARSLPGTVTLTRPDVRPAHARPPVMRGFRRWGR